MKIEKDGITIRDFTEYAQAYRVSGEVFDEYDYPDDGHIVFAMDQLIGEPECWNKGIGSSLL